MAIPASFARLCRATRRFCGCKRLCSAACSGAFPPSLSLSFNILAFVAGTCVRTYRFHHLGVVFIPLLGLQVRTILVSVLALIFTLVFIPLLVFHARAILVSVLTLIFTLVFVFVFTLGFFACRLLMSSVARRAPRSPR